MAARPSSIDEFSEKVKELYESDPSKVRFVLKYRHADGTVTLRATNDEFWLIYKTDQAAEQRRLEALQLWLMAMMCNVSPDSLEEEVDDEETTVVGSTTRRRRGGKKKGGGAAASK